MSSLIFYLTPDLQDLLIIDSGSLTDGNTPAMQRFLYCAVACKEAGFEGFSVDVQKRNDGSSFLYWQFDPTTPEGRQLFALQEAAKLGVMPPQPEEVLANVRRGYE